MEDGSDDEEETTMSDMSFSPHSVSNVMATATDAGKIGNHQAGKRTEVQIEDDPSVTSGSADAGAAVPAADSAVGGTSQGRDRMSKAKDAVAAKLAEGASNASKSKFATGLRRRMNKTTRLSARELRRIADQSMARNGPLMDMVENVKVKLVDKAGVLFVRLQEKIVTRVREVVADVSTAMQQEESRGSLVDLLHQDDTMLRKTTDMISGPVKLMLFTEINRLKGMGSLVVALGIIPALILDWGQECSAVPISWMPALGDFVFFLLVGHIVMVLARFTVHRRLRTFQREHNLDNYVSKTVEGQRTPESEEIARLLDNSRMGRSTAAAAAEAVSSASAVGQLNEFDSAVNNALALGEDSVVIHYQITRHWLYRLCTLAQMSLLAGTALGCYYALKLTCEPCEQRWLIALLQMNSLAFLCVLTYVIFDILLIIAITYYRLFPRHADWIVRRARAIDAKKLGPPVLETLIKATLELDHMHIKKLVDSQRRRQLTDLRRRRDQVLRRIRRVETVMETRAEAGRIVRRVVNAGTRGAVDHMTTPRRTQQFKNGEQSFENL